MSEANEKSGAWLSTFYRAVSEGIIVIDRKGQVIYSNYAAETIFDLKGQQGAELRFLSCIGDDLYKDGLKDAITDVLFSETHKLTRKVRYRNDRKSYVFMLSSIAVNTESFKGIIIAFSDITQLEKLEKTEKRLQLEQEQHESLLKQNEILTEAFDHHLDDAVVEQLLNAPEGLAAPAMKRRMALFMLQSPSLSHLISEMAPEAYLSMLNHYFDRVISIIKRNKGTVLELHYDSVLAAFGAPREIPNYTDQALLAAEEIQAAIDKIDQENHVNLLPEFAARIGIHTGEFPIGIIGGTGVLKYDVFGKNINFTARMTVSASDRDIVLSQDALNDLKNNYKIIETYEFIPKGISEAVTVYKVHLL